MIKNAYIFSERIPDVTNDNSNLKNLNKNYVKWLPYARARSSATGRPM